MDYLKRLMKYLDDCKLLVTVGLILALAGIFCNMAVPKVSKHIIDDVLVASASSERIFEVLSIEPEIKEDKNPVEMSTFKNSIKFKNV